jgi:hypothetical protein
MLDSRKTTASDCISKANWFQLSHTGGTNENLDFMGFLVIAPPPDLNHLPFLTR